MATIFMKFLSMCAPYLGLPSPHTGNTGFSAHSASASLPPSASAGWCLSPCATRHSSWYLYIQSSCALVWCLGLHWVQLLLQFALNNRVEIFKILDKIHKFMCGQGQASQAMAWPWPGLALARPGQGPLYVTVAQVHTVL